MYVSLMLYSDLVFILSKLSRRLMIHRERMRLDDWGVVTLTFTFGVNGHHFILWDMYLMFCTRFVHGFTDSLRMILFVFA